MLMLIYIKNLGGLKMQNNELLTYFFGNRETMTMSQIKRCDDFMKPIIKKQNKNKQTKKQALRGLK